MAHVTDFMNRDEKAFVERSANEISNHYGLGCQMEKLAEECAEYTQAWLKYHQDPTTANFEHLLEEMADTSLVLSEVLNCLPEPDGRRVAVKTSIKVNRELNRIEKSKAAKRVLQ